MEAFSGREREGHVLLCIRELDWNLLIMGQQLLKRWWEIGPYINNVATPSSCVLADRPSCLQHCVSGRRKERERASTVNSNRGSLQHSALPCPIQQCCTFCRTILVVSSFQEAGGLDDGWNEIRACYLGHSGENSFASLPLGYQNQMASSAHWVSILAASLWCCQLRWPWRDVTQVPGCIHVGKKQKSGSLLSQWQWRVVHNTRISSCHGDHVKLSSSAGARG